MMTHGNPARSHAIHRRFQMVWKAEAKWQDGAPETKAA